MPKRKTVRSIKTMDVSRLTFHALPETAHLLPKVEYAAAGDCVVMCIKYPAEPKYYVASVGWRDWHKFEPWNNKMPKLRSQWYRVEPIWSEDDAEA